MSRASIQLTQDAERARVAKLAAEKEAERPGSVKRPDPIEENPNRVRAPSEADFEFLFSSSFFFSSPFPHSEDRKTPLYVPDNL